MRGLGGSAKGDLLASSPTVEGIHKLITEYFGGERKELQPVGENLWYVLRGNGTPIETVQVRLEKGRYRFERRPRGESSMRGLGGSEWDDKAEDILRVLDVPKRAREAASQNIDDVECLPGSYEKNHLSYDEYAASPATSQLEGGVEEEIEALDLHDFDAEKVRSAVRRMVNDDFFDPYVRELKRLRPELRECGDEGGVDGMKGLKGNDWHDNHMLEEEVYASMAWIMWALAYAQAWDEAYEEGEAERPPWSGGGRIDDYVPETPDEILAGAKQILEHAIDKSKASLKELVDAAADGDVEEFGQSIGHAWMGSGGGDIDDRALRERGFNIGHGELHVFLVDGDPETIEINYFGGTGLSAKRIADEGGVNGLGDATKDRADLERARRAVDAGDLDTAVAIVARLAVYDEEHDLAYDVRMRLNEAVGAIERAGGQELLRTELRFLKGKSHRVPGPSSQELADKHHEARMKRFRARHKTAWGR